MRAISVSLLCELTMSMSSSIEKRPWTVSFSTKRRHAMAPLRGFKPASTPVSVSEIIAADDFSFTSWVSRIKRCIRGCSSRIVAVDSVTGTPMYSDRCATVGGACFLGDKNDKNACALDCSGTRDSSTARHTSTGTSRANIASQAFV